APGRPREDAAAARPAAETDLAAARFQRNCRPARRHSHYRQQERTTCTIDLTAMRAQLAG
ncbi:MAG: hypothetical protein M3Z75_22070, partial [Actinomycetota bacterium]|nr:hypothetical protein [Actinomycetota bacterium]